MKSREEIEQLAFLEYPRVINDPYNPMEDDNAYERQIWIEGYIQCQEDMADERKMIMETLLKIRDCKDYENNSSTLAKELINSLNKQD
jgi:hypothetical protein